MRLAASAVPPSAPRAKEVRPASLDIRGASWRRERDDDDDDERERIAR